MKIACYCQHVLGIGHFHRSLEICKALAKNHETVMILGGPDVTLPESDISFFQLPGLKMDKDFSKLLPCELGKNLETIKNQRQQQLFDFFLSFQPDIFLIELYPFGRKAFRFELDPVLDGISSGSLSPCIRLCSLRDILVEKTDKQKYETRVLTILNNSFDGLLIHSDPAFIPLEKTFSSTSSISIPYRYTGFISPEPVEQEKGKQLRKALGLSQNDKLIIASIGGGNVGAELLSATAEAALLLRSMPELHIHLFTGMYSAPGLQAKLQQLNNENITIHSFSSRFTDWLSAADLSISMAGYNTCMNLLSAGIPALLYPFAQNREQRMRVSALSKTSVFTLLEPDDLVAKTLADKIKSHLQQHKQKSSVKLNGAKKSSEFIDCLSIWDRDKT
jgi:predicted glycosyltransferase